MSATGLSNELTSESMSVRLRPKHGVGVSIRLGPSIFLLRFLRPPIHQYAPTGDLVGYNSLSRNAVPFVPRVPAQQVDAPWWNSSVVLPFTGRERGSSIVDGEHEF